MKRLNVWFCVLLMVLSSCSEEKEVVRENLQLSQIRLGGYTLNLNNPAANNSAPADQPLIATFSAPLEKNSVSSSVILKTKSGAIVDLEHSYLDNDKSFSGQPVSPLVPNAEYELTISDGLRGSGGQVFPGITISFKTVPGTLTVTSLKFNGVESLQTLPITDVARSGPIEITFSAPIKPAQATSSFMRIFGGGVNAPLNYSVSEGNKKVTLTPVNPLADLTRFEFWVSNELKGEGEESFSQFTRYFYTQVDPTPKFPLVSDEELLTLIQKQTFRYFWDFAHPASGMARERNSSGNLVTSGGSGFGIMALIVGMERGFITRSEGLERIKKILTFLETADRFHGAWSHWIDGNTGKVIPFSPNDNGGDLVETSFLVQGLLTFRQYLDVSVPEEDAIRQRINGLWEGVEWDWYRQNNQNVLYWHWSPDKAWVMNHQIRGWNECLITYVLGASSTTHSIPKNVYENGWAANGSMKNGSQYEGIVLPLGSSYGGPLFFSHYSFLGLDPRRLQDQYATSYFVQNQNHSKINHAYCVRNPKKFVGYSDSCWGLTASDNHQGYSAHSPTNDLGVISPTAALSSFPYTPDESMKALKFFYYTYGDRLFGNYGFYDAFNITAGWVANSTLAIDQGPIIIMIENHRTGLLWELFMSAPEVQTGLTKLGFVY